MDYLDRLGAGNQIAMDRVRKFIKTMESDWVDFDIKYSHETEALTLTHHQLNSHLEKQEDIEN